MIVRWGLAELRGVLEALGIERPLLVASHRWGDVDLRVQTAASWSEVPSERITEATLNAGDTVILGESDVARFEYQM